MIASVRVCGCREAPQNWNLYTPEFLNRVYIPYGGKAWYGAENTPLETSKLYLFPYRYALSAHQDPDNRLKHLFFNFTMSPPLLSREPIVLSLGEDAALYHLTEAARVAIERNNCPEELAQSLLESILHVVLRLRPQPTVSDERVLYALDHFHRDFSQPLSIRDLAREIGVEENHFIRLFHKEIGATPYKYLREYRLSLAVSRLQQGAPLSEAAALSGFDSMAAFSRAIRARTGLPPSAIRDMAIGKDGGGEA